MNVHAVLGNSDRFNEQLQNSRLLFGAARASSGVWTLPEFILHNDAFMAEFFKK